MTVLSAIQQASTVIGVDVPSIVFASTEREHVELASVANEMAKRIVEAHDWTRLRTIGTITGDGVSEGFSFPANYLRMIKKARLWSTSQDQIPLRHVPDSDRWLEDEITGFTGITGEWTLFGGQIHIRPVLANGEAARFFYVSNQIAIGKTDFTDDADVFLLDERVLKLGIIWQWKANKGLPYGEDMTNYENALSVAVGNDKGSNILTIGSGRIRGGAEYAFPHVINP